MKDILLLTGPTGALGGPLIEALTSWILLSAFMF